MFLRDLLSNDRSGKQQVKQPVLQPVTFTQAKQVAGGCSNPKGCTIRNYRSASVPPRQPAIPDFMDRQGGYPMPFMLQQ